MPKTPLQQNLDLMRSQIDKLVIAAKAAEEANDAQLEDKSEDVSKQPPATPSLAQLTELDHRIKSLYQPQIGSMQHQIAALMAQVEQLMEQVKAKNA